MFLLRLNINWERQRCLSITSSSSTVISAYRLAVTFAVLAQCGIQSIPTFSSGCSNKYWALLEDNLPVIFSSYDPYCTSDAGVENQDCSHNISPGQVNHMWYSQKLRIRQKREITGNRVAISPQSPWLPRDDFVVNECPLSLRKLRRT